VVWCLYQIDRAGYQPVVPKFRRVSSLTILLSFAACINSGASATSLEGKVDTTKLTGDANSSDNFIQGGIKDSAPLEPSLKVIPGQARKSGVQLHAETPKYFFPKDANLTQFHGGTQISGPARPPLLPITPTPEVEQIRGNSRIGHQIAPISSYTLTPSIGTVRLSSGGSMALQTQKGVSSYVPGYEISHIDTHKGVTNFVPGHSVQQPPMHNGISAYSPGFSSVPNPISSLGGSGHFLGPARRMPGPLSREGVTAYAPGYSSVPVPSTTGSGIASWMPGHSTSFPGSRTAMTEHVPGYQVTITTPKNGVVSWDSRYETNVVHNSLTKQTLGGMWYEPERVRPDAGDRARTETLATKPVFAVPVVDTPGQSLRATALGLPGMQVAPTAELSWGEWYQRVARAVYGRWQNFDVGPGRATVAVTVNKDRSISGQVVEFIPAADVERDVEEETDFKKAALSAVNLVSSFEIPEFPPNAEAESVTFNVEMKREVDGPVGFDVASTPTPGAAAPAGSLKSEQATPEASAAKPATKKAPPVKPKKKR